MEESFDLLHPPHQYIEDTPLEQDPNFPKIKFDGGLIEKTLIIFLIKLMIFSKSQRLKQVQIKPIRARRKHARKISKSRTTYALSPRRDKRTYPIRILIWPPNLKNEFN